MTAKLSGIIYLQRESFQLFSPYLQTVVEFRFVPEIVKDLDVINKELLESLVKVFIATNKIPPSNLSIIIADNAAFINDFVLPPATPQQPQPDPNAQDALKVQANKFIEHVPFEDVVSKTFPSGTGIKVFAANKDLYESIKSAFEKSGFTFEAIIPGLLFGNGLSTKPALDVQTANFMISKLSSLKENNLLAEPSISFAIQNREMEAEVEESEPEGPPKIVMGMPEGKDKKRLYLMVGVFAVLIIVLVIVYFQSQAPAPQQNPALSAPPQSNTAVQQTTTTNTANTQPIVNPTAVVPQNTLEAKDLTVTIINPSNSLQSAQKLKAQLETSGFKTVQIQNQPTTGISQSSITFSAKPSIPARDIIIAEVKKIAPQTTIQEKKESTVDITIVLVK